jgi:hypothetical protein
MSPQDKLSCLTDFTDWRNQKLPLLCCAGNAWNSKLVAMFDEGLDLISVFAYTTDFVAKSRLFRDYARRVPRLSYYVDKILREVIATAPAPTVNTEAAAPQPRRRGRPTKAESAAMEQQRAEAARAEVAARLIHDPLRAMAEQKPAQPAAQGDLFGPSPAPKVPSSSSSTSLSAALALSGGKLHIDQLAWLLSADLRERTTHIAELRSVAAAESNQAKELAERDVPEAVIQPHTAAAIKATNEYKAIYAAIDRELGTMYAQLTSGKHTVKYEQLCQSRGITTAQLADILLPYWEKIGSPAATEEAAPATPETDEEKKARQLRLHSIRTYFTRKDRIMKPARIAKMRGMIDELRGYGLPTEEYEAMLAKAEEELSNDNVDDNENDNE